MIFVLLFINIVLLVFGQTLWKTGLTGIELEPDLDSLLRLASNLYIIGGLVVYGVATVIWLYILSKSELSLVYPLQSLSYVVAAIVAIIVFKENISMTRWAGLGFIILGAYFVSVK